MIWLIYGMVWMIVGIFLLSYCMQSQEALKFGLGIGFFFTTALFLLLAALLYLFVSHLLILSSPPVSSSSLSSCRLTCLPS
jgi:hypothetical protein